MKLKKPTDIIIIDPYDIVKDKDWGPGEIFDWETCKINSDIFTEYIWCDYVKEGVVYMINKKVNEVTLNEILKTTTEDINDFNGTDYLDQSISKLQENQRIMGSFSSTTGCIGVFILDEVLKYNPDFSTGLSINDYYITIREFEGRIKVHKEPETVNILGIGNNKTFYTI